MTVRTFFSGGTIDRRSWQRADSSELARRQQSNQARFIAVGYAGCLTHESKAHLLKAEALKDFESEQSPIYLGQLNDFEIFAIDIADQPVAAEALSLSSILGEFDAADAALLAYAKGMIEWQRRHRFCGLCGARNQSTDGGCVLECSRDACEHRQFPRVDPAIIVLTEHTDRCLLGRQPDWPAGRFSTLAGFVEPGESFEDAVSREVFEETGVNVADCEYLASQPWPFPSAVMVGFHARAVTTDITLIDAELAEAHWFNRQQLSSGSVQLPPPTSIAYRLIEQWFDQYSGPSLATFDVSSSFSRSK